MSDDLFGEIEVPDEMVAVAFRARDLEFLGYLTQQSPEVAIVELLQQRIKDAVHQNGHRPTVVVHRAGQFAHVCAACGDEFTSNRRPRPGRHSWCGKPECKKQAAAWRAEEYRRRRAQA